LIDRTLAAPWPTSRLCSLALGMCVALGQLQFSLSLSLSLSLSVFGFCFTAAMRELKKKKWF
jgi:uncharacterized membrane protein YccC